MKTHENNANPKDIRFRSTLFRSKNVAIRGRSTVWNLEAPVLRRSLRRRGRRVVASSRACASPFSRNSRPNSSCQRNGCYVDHFPWLRSPRCTRLLRFKVIFLCLQKYTRQKRCIKEEANRYSKRNNLDKFWYFMIFPPTWNKGSFQVTCRSKWRDDSLATKLLSRGEVVQWPCLKIVFLRPWRTCYFGFGKDCRRRIMGIYK